MTRATLILSLAAVSLVLGITVPAYSAAQFFIVGVIAVLSGRQALSERKET